jgi:hypothetical protein
MTETSKWPIGLNPERAIADGGMKPRKHREQRSGLGFLCSAIMHWQIIGIEDRDLKYDDHD